MSKMKILSKCRKGFTLVELIAVMAMMAIAAAIAVPNMRGMISNLEQRTYQSYCMLATSYTRGYVSNLNLGIDQVYYVTKDKRDDYYTITDAAEFTSAMNEYNTETAFSYYVMPFAKSFTSDPSATVTAEITGGKLPKKDVVIVCIKKDSVKYSLKGMWYYSYEKKQIVATYFAAYNKITSSVTYESGAVVEGRVNFTETTK